MDEKWKNTDSYTDRERKQIPSLSVSPSPTTETGEHHSGGSKMSRQDGYGTAGVMSVYLHTGVVTSNNGEWKKHKHKHI